MYLFVKCACMIEFKKIYYFDEFGGLHQVFVYVYICMCMCFCMCMFACVDVDIYMHT